MADFACVVEPRFGGEGGPPNFSIRQSSEDQASPTLVIIVLHGAMPRVGAQSSSSFDELAKITVDTLEWTAGTHGGSGSKVGTFALVLTTVRAVGGSSSGAYELHGTIDARLVQEDALASSTGYVDLHVDF